MLLLTYAGHLADKVSVRRIFLVGEIAIGIALAGCAFTRVPWQMMVLLLVAGFGNAVAGPCSAKAVVTWFPTNGRATAMGIKQCAIPFAGLLAGAIAPSLALQFGWRTAFVIMGAMIAFLAIVGFALYRDAIPQAPRRTTKPTISSNGPGSENKKTLKAVFNREIVLLSVGTAFLMGVQYAGSSYLVMYLGDILKASTRVSPLILAGLLLSVAQAGGMIGRVGWGVVSDHLFGGRRKGTLIGLNVVAFAVILGIAFFTPHSGVFVIGVLVFLFGLTAIGWTGLHLSLVSEIAGAAAAGAATGFTLAISFFGMMLVPPIFGYLVDVTHGYLWGWLMLAALTFVGVIFLAAVRESQHKQ